MGERWHVVITLPKHGEKLTLQTTVKTQHHLALTPTVQVSPLLPKQIQFGFCEARDRSKTTTIPKSFNFSTFFPYRTISNHWVVSWAQFQQLLRSALEGMLMSTAGASYRHLRWETGAEQQLLKRLCWWEPRAGETSASTAIVKPPRVPTRSSSPEAVPQETCSEETQKASML